MQLTSLISANVMLRLVSNGITTPFGIKQVNSTTSVGDFAQKLYVYALGMCTMMSTIFSKMYKNSMKHKR